MAVEVTEKRRIRYAGQAEGLAFALGALSKGLELPDAVEEIESRMTAVMKHAGEEYVGPSPEFYAERRAS